LSLLLGSVIPRSAIANNPQTIVYGQIRSPYRVTAFILTSLLAASFL